MTDFDALVRSRRRLRRFCLRHVPSVLAFLANEAQASFRLHLGEANAQGRRLQHLTTSATCIESLQECPKEFVPKGEKTDAEKLAATFAVRAAALPSSAWKSDGSAQIYCRCRSLPLIVRSSKRYSRSIGEHIQTILMQMIVDPDRLAIGEAYVKGRYDTDNDDWYPPNAYHTYWTLNVLDEVDANDDFQKHRGSLDQKLKLNARRRLMVEWAWKELGTQVGLHVAGSSTLDTDQLMWTVAIVATHDDLTARGLSGQDLMTRALKCVFGTQEEVGTWRHYRPLFHYRNSGNAYSHVHEAMDALIRASLRRNNRFMRAELRQYLPNLDKLVQYTRLTAQLHDDRLAWSSGHRTNTSTPEGWATANVFTFLQSLRRLVGVWTKEAARDALPRRAVRRSRTEARDDLRRRGDTWRLERKGVGSLLDRLFVAPLSKAGEPGPRDLLDDPDRSPINEDQARSAILFGPPGTSKTTLVGAIADAIRWDYVEIHASHFVADGLPNVQKTADRIFQYVGELDRYVVLFDEIDELVRDREESDAFGRFLTTSMLPKIGELWKGRRILYFVATNHVEYFDAAIVRSERFDAAVFVPPPSFRAKRNRLRELLIADGLDVQGFAVQKRRIDRDFLRLLENVPPHPENPESDVDTVACPLAPFVVLRWDELDELAVHLRSELRAARTRIVRPETLANALGRMGDRRLQNPRTYRPFLYRDRARLDYRMVGVLPP